MDYGVLETLVVVAVALLILDVALDLLMKLRLLDKCRVICEDPDSD